jgi:mutual gliding-motility protein MglA
MEANIESLDNLKDNLEEQGYDLDRDSVRRPVQQAGPQLNPMGVADFEAVALEGKGVFETLTAVSKAVVKALS